MPTEQDGTASSEPSTKQLTNMGRNKAGSQVSVWNGVAADKSAAGTVFVGSQQKDTINTADTTNTAEPQNKYALEATSILEKGEAASAGLAAKVVSVLPSGFDHVQVRSENAFEALYKSNESSVNFCIPRVSASTSPCTISA